MSLSQGIRPAIQEVHGITCCTERLIEVSYALAPVISIIFSMRACLFFARLRMASSIAGKFRLIRRQLRRILDEIDSHIGVRISIRRVETIRHRVDCA